MDMRIFLKTLLETSGYQPLITRDGSEGLQKASEITPDLIILDVMMPRMDGFETLKKLRADDKSKEIPVIMLTAKAQDADIFKGWSSGVDSYLTKPFNPRELLAFVERIFQSLEHPPEDYDAPTTYEV
ncbi:MAG: response regulator, partial [Armatimonadetes bacterium]|nr:response regulator [Armatimonadota bacterium]